jgi:hypothetical protein
VRVKTQDRPGPTLDEVGLTRAQLDRLRRWLPGAVLLAEHSWGLTDTVVLHLRHAGRELTVKAFGPTNHHFERELAAHRELTGPLLAEERVPRLVHADAEDRILVTTWLPGRLVQGDPAEDAPDTYRQAGRLLRRWHDGQGPGRPDPTWLPATRDRTLRWLDGPHRIPADLADAVRDREWPEGAVTLVPTHGDYQPRNWVVDGGRVSVIDLGRAAWRPAGTDLARLHTRQWRGRPDLEAAFLEGYGGDPRPSWWPTLLLAEAVGTAAWAHQVGDERFEAEGLATLRELLEEEVPPEA